jgi:hypothetical protein
MNEQNNRPETEISSGNISIAVWNNKQSDGRGNSFYSKSITISKRYRAGEEWKKTSNYRPDELPKIIVLLSELYRELILEKNDERESNNAQSYNQSGYSSGVKQKAANYS